MFMTYELQEYFFTLCLKFDLIQYGHMYEYVCRLNLNFDLIRYGMGKFSKVMELWMCMNLSTLLVVYPGFYYWSIHRTPGKKIGQSTMVQCILGNKWM